MVLNNNINYNLMIVIVCQIVIIYELLFIRALKVQILCMESVFSFVYYFSFGF